MCVYILYIHTTSSHCSSIVLYIDWPFDLHIVQSTLSLAFPLHCEVFVHVLTVSQV